MKTKNLTAAATVLAMVMSFGSAAFACGDNSCEPPTETKKGNNGWGNGGDTTNAGSDKGGTAPSKFASTER
ncbi:MAG: hypothetical protein J0L76_11235 [Rhodobacterales bacterium]|nr:hypothetical protein [Rhodobacterales bacterium]